MAISKINDNQFSESKDVFHVPLDIKAEINQNNKDIQLAADEKKLRVEQIDKFIASLELKNVALTKLLQDASDVGVKDAKDILDGKLDAPAQVNHIV